MNDAKYIGMDVHRATISVAVRDSDGNLVGWAAIFIGLTGVILHLESHFFYERTIRSLTYSAPFAAPLAYTGLGFLLILNRMVDSAALEWAHWIRKSGVDATKAVA